MSLHETMFDYPLNVRKIGMCHARLPLGSLTAKYPPVPANLR